MSEPVHTPVHTSTGESLDLQERSSLPQPKQRGRRSISAAMRTKFLDHIADGGTAREAARMTGRHHSTWYELAKKDDAFADAWKDAEESGTRMLAGEANRRAIEGYYVTRFDAAGNVLWREHRHDNTLLTKVLGARDPERWRENARQRVELSGSVSNPSFLVEDRSASLADVAAVLKEAGAFDGLNFGAAAEIERATGQDLAASPLALPPGEAGS